MKAGSLYHLFAFDARDAVSDGAGNTQGAFVEQFQCNAGRLVLRGGETVMAARLEGRQPVILSVRAETRTNRITSDWRARDVRTGEVFNIRSIQPSEKRDAIELLCEAGVADG